MEILLIVSNLDNKRHIKSFLKIFVEDERQHVTKMKSFWGGSSSCVKIKWWKVWVGVFFKGRENDIQISVREENISGQIFMGWLFGQFLDSAYEVFVQVIASKFFDKFVVVNLFSGGVGDHVRVDDDLFFLSWLLFVLFCFSTICLGLYLILCRLGGLFVFHRWECGLKAGSEKSGVK